MKTCEMCAITSHARVKTHSPKSHFYETTPLFISVLQLCRLCSASMMLHPSSAFVSGFISFLSYCYIRATLFIEDSICCYIRDLQNTSEGF